MAIVGSGALSFTAIQNEFGGSHPISLGEYYRNGGAVPSNNTNVSESGLIRAGMFYNAVNEIGVAVSSGASTYNVQTAFSSYWNVAVPKRLTINSGVTLGHLTVPASMAGTLIIDNAGAVQGLGGNSAGAAGSTAMTIQSTGVTINLASGSTISGGGGSGNLGGTGGQSRAVVSAGTQCSNMSLCSTHFRVTYNWWGGTHQCNAGCSQGGCCYYTDNCDKYNYTCNYYNYTNGGAGGAHGVAAGYGQSQTNGAAGTVVSGAGDGGSGGNGGSFGVAGSNGSSGANGNYTNGSAGSAGGAAGRAITFSTVSAYTVIGTNSGTIHGAYT